MQDHQGNFISVIPARLAASRFPGKPMHLINNVPMIERCYKNSVLAFGNQNTFVATCDHEIAECINSLGGRAVMTSKTHERATTRTAEAVDIIQKDIGIDPDVIVMVQGDEPLIRSSTIITAAAELSECDAEILNVVTISNDADFVSDRNNVKVVIDKNDNALYFSRECIPSKWKDDVEVMHYIQTGIIAFKKNALAKFNQMPEAILEIAESVDMNRALYQGEKIKVIAVDYFMVGVDNLLDVKAVEQELDRLNSDKT